MTHYYSIEFIKFNVFLKATYKGGKWKRLEHVRGKVTRELMDAVGKAIPLKESEIGDFNKVYFNRINYAIEVKQNQTIYSRFNEAWHIFYENQMSVPPKFTGKDGKALKSIISYLERISLNQKEAFAFWQLILDNWHELSEFHQKYTDLTYINSKLNVIIREIKTKKDTNIGGTDRSVEL